MEKNFKIKKINFSHFFCGKNIKIQTLHKVDKYRSYSVGRIISHLKKKTKKSVQSGQFL